MRELTLPGLEAATSCLGFGCASLGSRVSPAQSIKALAHARDAGIRWFDIAPAYGAGEAESLLGRFLTESGGRETVQICTKVGLVPPAQSPAKRLIRSALRPVVAVARPLRAAIRRSGATSNTSVPLTPELLQGSLERSLTRLGTDRVEVYALHNADPADLARDDILRALEDLLASGKARTIAVAGQEDAARAALAQGAPFGVIQLAQPLGAGAADLARQAASQGVGSVTHSVFGVAGQLAALTGQLKSDPALQARLAEAGYDGAPEDAGSALLMARAFAANAAGVVLASMASERSLHRNLAAAARPLDPGAIALCAEIGV